jgi:hypothetical protein
MPNPIKATRTVGIGSQTNCNTSVCPAGRAGVAVAIISVFFSPPQAATIPVTAKNNKKEIKLIFFMIN